jgi:hypothetical protein
MLPDDARVISVDDHIIEHPKVWEDRLPAHLVERGPRVVYEDGVPIWMYDGHRHAPLGLDAVAGDDPTEFKLNSKAFELMRPGCYDPVARLRDMDEDGVTRPSASRSSRGSPGRASWRRPIAISRCCAYGPGTTSSSTSGAAPTLTA